MNILMACLLGTTMIFPVIAADPTHADETVVEEEAVESIEGEAHPPSRKGAKPKPSPKNDDLKLRLAEIAKVFKNQMGFAKSELEVWKEFWTKARDERGLFEMRLAKQRDGFVESLRSLDPRDHGQSLVDYETMQNNVMRSFEENQSAKIREFILERENKIREFGATQESERSRLAQSTQDSWEEEKARMNLTSPEPAKTVNRKKTKGGKDKDKDKDSKNQD